MLSLLCRCGGPQWWATAARVWLTASGLPMAPSSSKLPAGSLHHKAPRSAQSILPSSSALLLCPGAPLHHAEALGQPQGHALCIPLSWFKAGRCCPALLGLYMLSGRAQALWAASRTSALTRSSTCLPPGPAYAPCVCRRATDPVITQVEQRLANWTMLVSLGLMVPASANSQATVCASQT